MEYYPLKLSSIPKNIIWGGDRMKQLYGKEAPFERIAESWELSVREGDMSIIENGCYKGRSLGNLLEDFPEAVGTAHRGSSFPLLVKFIDAGDDLSIQVHPSSRAAAEFGGEEKTEMWYIVDADEYSHLIYGLREDMTPAALEDALKNGKLYSALNKIPVKKGEVYFIPAGQLHAICSGVMIAEIQQNSDTTYRLYDYDRIQADGTKRELHINEALASVRYFADAEIDSLRFDSSARRRSLPEDFEVLCSCIYFRVSRAMQENGKSLKLFADKSSFAVLLFTDAYNTSVSCGGVTVCAEKGDCILLPAGSGEFTLSGDAEVLLCEL